MVTLVTVKLLVLVSKVRSTSDEKSINNYRARITKYTAEKVNKILRGI